MKPNNNFIKTVLFLIAAAFLAACSSAQSTQNPSLSSSSPASNQIQPALKPMPPVASAHGAQTDNQVESNLSWRLVDGNQKTFANYRGKAVILDFWATFCPPCEEEIPHLVELSNKYPKDLQIVGLHVGGVQDKPNIADFVSKYRMSYDLGYPEQDLMDFYLEGDDRIPQTLVFDRKGRLVRKFVGFTPAIKADLDRAVDQALKSE
ncbi:MAG: TlpA disulfide reductase family protein, partial [Pyrinomonadaceae bacterium]